MVNAAPAAPIARRRVIFESSMPPSLSESSSLSQLAGVWAAAITPRRPSGHEIDLGASLDVIDFLAAHPVAGIALLGATGEFVHFDIAERTKLAAMAIRRSPRPVIVNVSHSTYPGTLSLAMDALSAGARAVLVMPPYFFRYSQEAIVAFYERLARDGAQPVLVYNLPFFTTGLSPATVATLLESGTAAGIKDSSGDPAILEAALSVSRRAEAAVMIGNDRLFASEARKGANGVISGISCASPELMTALWQAIRAGDASRADSLDALVTECLPWLDRFPVPMGIKMAVNYRGIPAGPTAVPSGPQEAAAFGEFEPWFRDWLDRVLSACRNR
jgi:4-hydroxy-tetrahydrodipicolinate synthase